MNTVFVMTLDKTGLSLPVSVTH